MSAYDPKRTWVAPVSFRVAQQNAILLAVCFGTRASTTRPSYGASIATNIETWCDHLRHTLGSSGFGVSEGGETRTCETPSSALVCGDLVIGITLEQDWAEEAGRSIRAEEAEKRIQLQKLVELTERATSAEKDSLRKCCRRGREARVETESKG